MTQQKEYKPLHRENQIHGLSETLRGLKTSAFTGHKKTFTASSIFLLALLLGTSLHLGTVVAAPDENMVAFKTTTSIDVDGIPGELFWGQIPSLFLSLEGTTTYGGQVPHMWVKAAHNGTHLFLLMQWPDATESRELHSGLRLEDSTPGNLMGRFHYNETHFYSDSGAVTWWMGSQSPDVMPATGNHFGPAPTRSASLFGWSETDQAEMWQWKSWVLDIGSAKWPHGLENTWNWGDNAGEEYLMPHSSAYHSLFNYSGMFAFGEGLLHAEACQIPDTTAFDIWARGLWIGGMWTLEMARPFIASESNTPYTVKFQEGDTFWAAFAAFDGNRGENEEVASISDWVSVELSNELVPIEQNIQQAIDQSQASAEDAQQAQTTADQALSEAEHAHDEVENVLAAIDSTAMLAYVAIGVAAVAVVLAAVLGFRGRGS